MGRGVQVPITPSVLDWAIRESGLGFEAVARRVAVAEADLRAWLAGKAQPSLSSFHKLAAVLHRPTATFLLPRPPRTEHVAIEFRHPPGVADRELLPEERLRVREVSRLQQEVAWLLDEMHEPLVDLPKLVVLSNPEHAGKRAREMLGVDVGTQTSWRDNSVALREWRRRVEALGVLVFSLPMGAESARGFSIWTPGAPAIVLNTFWSPAARLYTLFHELAHLLTRTNSVCVEHGDGRGRTDDLERWCEQVAAAALMPEPSVRTFVRELGSINVAAAAKLAAQYRVSLRAATLRLIGLQLAGWALYRSLPPTADAKPGGGGGGGGGRNRPQKRLDEYGHRTVRTFLRAVQRDVITIADAMRYLDLGDQNLFELEKLAA